MEAGIMGETFRGVQSVHPLSMCLGEDRDSLAFLIYWDLCFCIYYFRFLFSRSTYLLNLLTPYSA